MTTCFKFKMAAIQQRTRFMFLFSFSLKRWPPVRPPTSVTPINCSVYFVLLPVNLLWRRFPGYLINSDNHLINCNDRKLLFICGSSVLSSIPIDQSMCVSSPEIKSTPVSSELDNLNTKVHKWKCCLKKILDFVIFFRRWWKNLVSVDGEWLNLFPDCKITALPKQPFPMSTSLNRWLLLQRNYLLIERALSFTLALNESPNQIPGVSACLSLIGEWIDNNLQLVQSNYIEIRGGGVIWENLVL